MARNTNKPINQSLATSVDKVEMTKDFAEHIGEWTSFYRAYPFIFAEDFLGVKLQPFQKILLYQMFHNDFNMFLASRGLGKSWLLSVFVICWAVLYPASKLVISAGQKRMSMEVVNYIKAFYDESECLKKSISYLSDAINDPKIYFTGGSTFKIAVASDNARGARCHVLILDEHRTIDLEVINTVLRQFASDRRRPKFYNLPEWKDYPMSENKEIYASSTYYCYHWAYDKFKDYVNQMQKGKKYFVADLPYQISVRAGLKSMKQIENTMQELTFNPISWSMEMEGRWIGQDSSAFYKHELLEDCRKLKKPFYEDNIVSLINSKNKKYLSNMKRIKGDKLEDNEIRLLFADIAMASGSENDNTVLGVMRLIPHQKVSGEVTKKYYTREVVYMKTISGGRVDYQAIQIRKLFDMFDCNYLVLDGMGLGQSIYDELSKPITDNDTGVEYSQPWTCVNYDKWKDRCTYSNAKPVVYAIIGSAQLNSDIHFEMLNSITMKKIQFLVSEMAAKDIINSISGFNDMNSDDKGRILEQYIQSSALINEMVNLKRVDKDNGLVKLVEPTSGLKDRYMAVAYANYIASTEFESKLTKNTYVYNEDEDDEWYFEL